jgi:hypothetical protein
MKTGIPLAVSFYLGFSVYILLMFVFGQSGIRSTAALRDHYSVLEQNIEDLRDIGAYLQLRRDTLLDDPAEARKLARSLGYFYEDEIRLILPDTEARISHTLGRAIRSYLPSTADQPLFRAIGVVFGSISFTGIFFLSRKHQ